MIHGFQHFLQNQNLQSVTCPFLQPSWGFRVCFCQLCLSWDSNFCPSVHPLLKTNSIWLHGEQFCSLATNSEYDLHLDFDILLHKNLTIHRSLCCFCFFIFPLRYFLGLIWFSNSCWFPLLFWVHSFFDFGSSCDYLDPYFSPLIVSLYFNGFFCNFFRSLLIHLDFNR